MALENNVSIGDPISCGADRADKLSLQHRGMVNLIDENGHTERKETLTLFAHRNNSSVTSIYMDREKVEELATYLMYWLHETKDAE